MMDKRSSAAPSASPRNAGGQGSHDWTRALVEKLNAADIGPLVEFLCANELAARDFARLISNDAAVAKTAWTKLVSQTELKSSNPQLFHLALDPAAFPVVCALFSRSKLDNESTGVPPSEVKSLLRLVDTGSADVAKLTEGDYAFMLEGGADLPCKLLTTAPGAKALLPIIWERHDPGFLVAALCARASIFVNDPCSAYLIRYLMGKNSLQQIRQQIVTGVVSADAVSAAAKKTTGFELLMHTLSLARQSQQTEPALLDTCLIGVWRGLKTKIPCRSVLTQALASKIFCALARAAAAAAGKLSAAREVLHEMVRAILGGLGAEQIVELLSDKTNPHARRCIRVLVEACPSPGKCFQSTPPVGAAAAASASASASASADASSNEKKTHQFDPDKNDLHFVSSVISEVADQLKAMEDSTFGVRLVEFVEQRIADAAEEETSADSGGGILGAAPLSFPLDDDEQSDGDVLSLIQDEKPPQPFSAQRRERQQDDGKSGGDKGTPQQEQRLGHTNTTTDSAPNNNNTNNNSSNNPRRLRLKRNKAHVNYLYDAAAAVENPLTQVRFPRYPDEAPHSFTVSCRSRNLPATFTTNTNKVNKKPSDTEQNTLLELPSNHLLHTAMWEKIFEYSNEFPVACKFWVQDGWCAKGAQCHFAHPCSFKNVAKDGGKISGLDASHCRVWGKALPLDTDIEWVEAGGDEADQQQRERPSHRDQHQQQRGGGGRGGFNNDRQQQNRGHGDQRRNNNNNQNQQHRDTHWDPPQQQHGRHHQHHHQQQPMMPAVGQPVVVMVMTPEGTLRPAMPSELQGGMNFGQQQQQQQPHHHHHHHHRHNNHHHHRGGGDDRRGGGGGGDYNNNNNNRGDRHDRGPGGFAPGRGGRGGGGRGRY